MNPLAIIAIVVAAIIGLFAISSSSRDGAGGPIASGPGSAEIRNPQPVSRSDSLFSRGVFGIPTAPPPSSPPPPAGAPPPPPGASPYQDRIVVASVQRSQLQPEAEYVILRYRGSSYFSYSLGYQSSQSPIDVTGWRIAGLRSSDVIPRAYTIPEIDAVDHDILLPPGGELIVVTGAPSYQKNFRENQCVGYFNESHSFSPSLSSSCPGNNPNRTLLLSMGFNGACVDAIQSVPACRTPQGPFPVGVLGQACLDYMNRNFSYVGCVKNFRQDPGFLQNRWRVFLRRPQKLFDDRHDRVTLRDQNGLVVDEFEY